jgi:uncharacterized protein (TIGR02145 family)
MAMNSHATTPLGVPSSTLPYQGLASESNGKPIVDGSYPVTFRLYGNAAAVATSALWSEAQSVGTTKGLFSTSLGLVTPIPDSLFNGTELYLGVAFNGGTESRTLLGTTPWAKASDSSRASRLSDSAKSVTGLKDSLASVRLALQTNVTNLSKDSLALASRIGQDSSAMRAKILADSIALATQRATDTGVWKALHRADSTLIASQAALIASLQSLIAPPPSNSIPWQTGLVYGSLTDSRDGHSYKTVRIGFQVWMAENLNYAGSGTTIGVCFGGSTDSCGKYGRQYTWNEALSGAVSSSANPSGVQGVCPTDWHVPSDAEWTILQASADGTQLKSTSGWSSSGNGTDAFGFRALPGGYSNGTNYINSGIVGQWWTTTESDVSNAWFRELNHSLSIAITGFDFKSNRYSIRCVQG